MASARPERARFACYARRPSSPRVSILASLASRLRSRAHQRWTITIAIARAGIDARRSTRARVPSHDESIVAHLKVLVLSSWFTIAFLVHNWRIVLFLSGGLERALGDASIDGDESRARRMTR